MRALRFLGLMLALTSGLLLVTAVIAATNDAEDRGPSDIELTITVGAAPGVCSSEETLFVTPETVVTYCYTVTNNGDVALPLHTLSDTQFGLLFTDAEYELGPGESIDSVSLGYAPTAMIMTDTTSSATWTAYAPGPSNINTDSDDVTVVVIPPLELEKTVGLVPDVCAPTNTIVAGPGLDVYYCYTVTNVTPVTRTLHDLVDSELGSILTGLEFALGPGASTSVVITGSTVTTDVVNTAQWTAYNPGPTGVITATSAATVELALPSIGLTKTVGGESGVCADTNSYTLPPWGGTVYYCYTVTNTGNVTLAEHDLSDSELGDLFSDVLQDLEPGESISSVALGLEYSALITETTSNNATWVATDIFGGSAEASADATVTITPIMPAVDVEKTVGTDPDDCATSSDIMVEPGTTVYFCYTVMNAGNFTLTLHSLNDTTFGTILDDFPLPLGPGQSISTADIGGLTFSQTVTTTTVNTATWMSYNPGPVDMASDSDVATVTIGYKMIFPVIYGN